MDKEEFQIKLDEINALVEKKDYKSAMEIVNSIDWRRVKNIRTLCTVGEIYAANKQYNDSREIFLLAYHRSPVGKTILYRLIELSIKMGDLKEANEYYDEFLNSAPNDNTQYILKYKILNAQKAPLEDQIKVLEEYKETEFTERWSYELVKLYADAGEKEKCIELCDEMAIWFGDGKYVIKSLDIKKQYAALSPSQNKIYESSRKPVVVPELKVPDLNLEKVKPEEKKEEEPKETEAESQENPVEEAGSDTVDLSKEAKLIKSSRKSIWTQPSVSPVEDDEDEEVPPTLSETIESVAKATPIFSEGEDFKKKITKGIKDLFGSGKKEESEAAQVEKQTTGQINIADIIPEMPEKTEEVKEETPSLVPEQKAEEVKPLEPEVKAVEIPSLEEEVKPSIPVLEPEQVKVDIPKFELPKMNLNETAKVEDLPVSDDFSINLEETILAAAAAQGIEVPEEAEEPEIPLESEPEESSSDEDTKVSESDVDSIPVNEDLLDGLSDLLHPEKPMSTSEEESNTADNPAEQTMSEENTEEPVVEETKEAFEEVSETPEEIQMDTLEQEDISSQPKTEEISEEEKLMRFIDEQNQDPNVDEKDIIPRGDRFDEEEVKLFKYFSSVPGMENQLVDALKDTQMSAADKTSKTGNVIIMGNKGSGKTTLADLLMKAICRELKMPAAKIAKVDSQKLTDQNIAKIVNQLSGGFLLIENVNQMKEEVVVALNQAMEFRTDGLTVILEDEKIGMRKFIARNPKFIQKFTSTINIPVFTNDELVNFTKVYTQEKGYRIEEMGILALYTLISDNQKEDEPMTVGAVKILVDNAIAKAESGTRKLQRNLSKTRTDRDGLILLYEKDFK